MNKKKTAYIMGKKLNMENKDLSKKTFAEADMATENNPSCKVYIEINPSLNRGSIFLDKDLKANTKIASFEVPDENEPRKIDDNKELSLMSEVKQLIENGYEAFIVGKKGVNIIVKITEKNDTTSKKKEVIKYKDLEDKLIKEKVLSKEELSARKNVLMDNGIKEDEVLYVNILELIRKQDNNITRPKKVYVMSSEKKGEESILKRVLRNISLGDPVILEGAKGTGKNVCWETISWILNRPMEILNCSAKMTKADMFGSPTTDNSAKGKVTLKGAKAFFKSLFLKSESDEASEFLYSVAGCMSPSIKLEEGPVTRALLSAKDKGTILIADELNLSDPNTFAGAFNALTDKHTREYNINGIGVVPVPDDLIIGGTQNGTGGAYIGTKQQNDATMSRFNVVRINAPDSIISVLNNNNFDIDYEVLQTLDRIYKSFAKAKKQGTVSEQALNVRGFERAVLHIMQGQTIIEAVKECVIYSCKASEEGILVNAALDQIK